MCIYDRECALQSTKFDIVEQREAPILMFLLQMRSLRFQLELHPYKALLSSPLFVYLSFLKRQFNQYCIHLSLTCFENMNHIVLNTYLFRSFYNLTYFEMVFKKLISVQSQNCVIPILTSLYAARCFRYERFLSLA